MHAIRNARTSLKALCLSAMLAATASGPAWAQTLPCTATVPLPASAPDFAAIAARVTPMVVKLTTAGSRHDVEADPDGSDLFSRGRPGGSAPAREAQWHSSYDRSSASGFIIDPDGLIVTSAHVVAQADVIWVDLVDQRRLQGRIVGLDKPSDVALIKVAASGLSPVVPARQAAHPCPGEWVLAVGAPFGFERSVTAGVVSANPRFLPSAGSVPLIQSDVAMNPGSSGGPLFNGRGEIVGMNSMIYSAIGSYVGVSFSSPIDLVLRIAQRIRTEGGVAHGHLGMTVQPVTPDLARAFGLDGPIGALVIRVDPSAAAARAGVRSGDIVLTVDDAAPASYADIQERVSMARPGQGLGLNIWRRRAMQRLTVVAEGEPVKPATQEAEPSPRALLRLGLSMMEVENSATAKTRPGLYVIGVAGAAMQAGLVAGDVVLGVNDAPVRSFADFDKALKAAAANPSVALLVLRRGAMNYIAVAAPAQPG